MNTEELAARVEAVCARDTDAFDAWVAEEAEWLLEAVADGSFDSEIPTVGLEYEFYGTDANGALRTLPESLEGLPGCEAEIGRHQLELQVSPQPLSPEGLDTVGTELRARFKAAADYLLERGGRLVSDGVWTLSPEGTDAIAYLTDYEDDAAAVPLATNMVDSVRYHVQSHEAATVLDAPHVSYDGETALLNSLTTSIQPHYALTEAQALPEYFRYALRIAGPLVALGVNSPLFPPELYDDDVDPETVLADSWQENRICVFESVMNAPDGPKKVDFPDDFDSVAAAIADVVEDPTLLPTEIQDGGPLAHFTHKHGSYWRWVRPVFDASGESGNVRIEFRPLPGQPTAHDTGAFLGLFAGLLTDLPRRDHPVAALDWETARSNFYAAAEDGLDADLQWIDSDGRRTTDTDELFGDLFACANRGLQSVGFDPGEASQVLAPLRARVEHRVTPASWRLDRVREGLAAGRSFEDAVRGAQRAYLREQESTFIHGRFDDWAGWDGPVLRDGPTGRHDRKRGGRSET